MRVRQNLLEIFNLYNVLPDDRSLEIAKHFKFEWSTKEATWTAGKREIMGQKISELFQLFLKQYNKHYRTDIAAKEFYQLTDSEIEDMFDELPYYISAYHGNEKYKPNAATFLKEKIWSQDYPNKPKRNKTSNINISSLNSWDEYITYVPDHNKATIEAYRDLMSFDVFKQMISGN